jgi:hypothetical protein
MVAVLMATTCAGAVWLFRYTVERVYEPFPPLMNPTYPVHPDWADWAGMGVLSTGIAVSAAVLWLARR